MNNLSTELQALWGLTIHRGLCGGHLSMQAIFYVFSWRKVLCFPRDISMIFSTHEQSSIYRWASECLLPKKGNFEGFLTIGVLWEFFCKYKSIVYLKDLYNIFYISETYWRSMSGLFRIHTKKLFGGHTSKKVFNQVIFKCPFQTFWSHFIKIIFVIYTTGGILKPSIDRNPWKAHIIQRSPFIGIPCTDLLFEGL